MNIQQWREVGTVDSIPLREGRRVRYEDYDVALFNLGGEFLAVDNRCPHKSGPLTDGIVSGKSVFCPLHNWKISLETGCALSGGQGQVKKYPVKTVGDKIYVSFESGAFCEAADVPAAQETAPTEID